MSNTETFTFGDTRIRDHCFEQWTNRIGSNTNRLIELVQILNQNVPDDWRLARFSPDFIIQDLKTGAVLVGDQHRFEGEPIIHKVIRTVLKHGGTSRDKRIRNYSKAVAGRPNLVIDGNTVFARQYEKVNNKNVIDSAVQYFRCHKLTKKGLSPEHKWLKWTKEPNQGTVKYSWVKEESIHKSFRGHDFWNIPVKRKTNNKNEHKSPPKRRI
ncbi:MAG: hypothetical protein JW703_02450 [Candidatus Diapherotrites archaeon]|nr:hypothetical protein [Candidatus Diapherotrites archaeon]